MLDRAKYIAGRVRKGFVPAVRAQTGESVAAAATGFQSPAQQRIANNFKAREKNVNDGIKNAREYVLANPGDEKGAIALKKAEKAKLDFIVDKAIWKAGAVAGDYIADGSRNLWWLINAAQAVSGLAGRKIMKDEGYGILGQALGATGLALGMELASGNIDPTNIGEAGRPKGYSTLFPKEIEQINPETGQLEIVLDRTKSNNPAAELAARYILNRTGNILPEEQFLKERPDVSPEEYARFRAAKNKNTFFGIEDMPIYTSAPLGAIAGAGLNSMSGRSKVAGALLGAISAPLIKEVGVDVPTSLGILHGTAETPDDPVGEIEFLGYRIPFKAIAATAALGAGLKYGSRAIRNRGPGSSQMGINLNRLASDGVTEYNLTPTKPVNPQGRRGRYE